MAISIKTPEDIEKMRVAGRLAAEVLEMIEPYVKPGVSTGELDRICNDYIVNEQHAVSACLGYHGYPKSVCISINEVVCHGMPKETEHLKSGAIVNVDITLEKDGLIADSSKMYLIGDVSPLARRLVKKTYEAMWKGIKVVRPGATLGDIGHAIQSYVESNGYSVVREYCGHGVGQEMHEEPQVLHYGKPGEGAVLREGMVFTIEPMVNQGDSRTKIKKDGWTVVTRDKKLSAQWEHTVAVTADGVEVLTLREDEIIPF